VIPLAAIWVFEEMSMSDTPKVITGRQLKADYIDCLSTLRTKATTFDNHNFDSESYRVEIEAALLRLKASIAAIGQSGFMDAISLLGKFNKELVSVVNSVTFPKAGTLLVEALTSQFEVGQDILDSFGPRDPQLRRKMLRSAWSQSDEPEQLARREVSKMLDGHAPVPEILTTFMTGLECCSPPYKDFDAPELVVLFNELYLLLLDDYEKRLPLAIESIAANMRIFATVVRHLLDFVATVQDDIKRRFVSYRLGLDAQFLVGVYELTQDPVIKALAEFTMDRPKGSMAYTYFDRIGVSRSQEWHFQEQERTTNAIQRACLYEYAVTTPGFEVNPSVIEPMNETVVQTCLTSLETVPLNSLEAPRKRQLVFDVLVNESKIDATGKIKRLLAGADLPIELYKPHLNLLGERFGSDMNL
jgi:hypothetical protein